MLPIIRLFSALACVATICSFAIPGSPFANNSFSLVDSAFATASPNPGGDPLPEPTEEPTGDDNPCPEGQKDCVGECIPNEDFCPTPADPPCPEGEVPGDSQECLPEGGDDCGDGTYCDSGSKCCGQSCMPEGDECCGSSLINPDIEYPPSCPPDTACTGSEDGGSCEPIEPEPEPDPSPCKYCTSGS